MKRTRYPKIRVDLSGEPRGRYATVQIVRTALYDAGVPAKEVGEFTREALISADLEKAIRSWVTVG